MRPCVMRPWYLHVCIRCLLDTPSLITQGSYSLFNDYTSGEGGGVEAIEGQNIQWAIGQLVTIGNGLLEGGKQQMAMIRQWTFRQGGDGRRPLTTTAVCLSAGVQVAGVSVSSLAGQALVRGQEGHPQIFIQVR